MRIERILTRKLEYESVCISTSSDSKPKLLIIAAIAEGNINFKDSDVTLDFQIRIPCNERIDDVEFKVAKI
jgi:hypothetical protein